MIAWLAGGLICRRCGHILDDHRHYRRGLDCGCGCVAFRVPWAWLALDWGGWLLVPPLAAVAWHAARAWPLATFVGAGTALCVAASILSVLGRFVGSEIAEQRRAGARIRDLPAYWWAVAHHRIGDEHDPMLLLDEQQRLNDDEPR